MAAATVDLSTGANDSRYQVYEKRPILRTHVVDFAKALALKGSALAQNDTVDLLPLYKGELLKSITVRVITAGTDSSTIAVGESDDSGTDNYIASVTVDSAAGTIFNAGGAAIFTQATSDDKPVTWVGGKYMAANKALRCTLGATAPQAGVLEFVAEIVPVGSGSTL